MTREEAITTLQEKYDYCKSFYDLAAHPEEDYPETAKYLQSLQMALSALRPVSREQVEKVWPGCEACKDASLAIGEVWLYGTFEGHIDVSGNLHYCPNCGRPITPVAKERQWERLEVLHGETD